MAGNVLKRFAAAAVLTAVALTAAGEEKVKRNVFVVQDGKVITAEGDFDGAAFRFGDILSGGFLGVETIRLTPELRTYFGVGKDEGVLVSRVVPDSPAEKAGLKAGDIITDIDGKSIRNTSDLSATIREKKDGEQARISFNRRGTAQQAFASIKVREKQLVDVPGVRGDGVRVFVDPDMPEAAMRFRDVFTSPEWQTRLERITECGSMQTKLKDLEKKLADLEKKLQQK